MPRRKRLAQALPDICSGDGILCRAAAPTDLDAVARIWLDGWLSTRIVLAQQPDYAMLRARIEQEIAGGWQLTVAILDDAIAGFVAMSPQDAVLEQIFVDPEWHRRGVGAALLAVARADMPCGFTLWTHGDNSGAAAFYAASGLRCSSHGIHPRQGHAITNFAFGPDRS